MSEEKQSRQTRKYPQTSAGQPSKEGKEVIFLFDVDGVVIDHIGYGIAIGETVKKISQIMGLSGAEPSKEIVRKFESLGVHDVWDMAGICISLIITDLTLAEQGIRFEGTTLERLNQLKKMKIGYAGPDYDQFIEENREIIESSKHPPDDIKKVLMKKIREELNDESFIRYFEETIDPFILNTRDAYKNFSTQLFQEIILGSEYFKEVYGLSPVLKTPSLLREKDKVFMKPESISLIREYVGSGRLKIAIYTGRPSYPPKEFKGDRKGYSPEAEIALDMAGFHHPLIGMGRMQWLGGQVGEPTEALTKPDFTQALAAIAVSQDNDELKALECAYRFSREDRMEYPLTELKGKKVKVYVFEDAQSGIKAVMAAVEALRSEGCDISGTGLGVSTSEVKREALRRFCEFVGNDVNECIRYALDKEFGGEKND